MSIGITRIGYVKARYYRPDELLSVNSDPYLVTNYLHYDIYQNREFIGEFTAYMYAKRATILIPNTRREDVHSL